MMYREKSGNPANAALECSTIVNLSYKIMSRCKLWHISLRVFLRHRQNVINEDKNSKKEFLIGDVGELGSMLGQWKYFRQKIIKMTI
jgi:hypothetical protein